MGLAVDKQWVDVVGVRRMLIFLNIRGQAVHVYLSFQGLTDRERVLRNEVPA